MQTKAQETATLTLHMRSEHYLLHELSVMPEEERACFCLPVLLSNDCSITGCFGLTGQTIASHLWESQS